ncbi:MAG: succinate dehydrogenase, cytochrome b556 subunit [Methylococcales bacterium]|nr:succinate dehydrogenase, cytochrome b556 subunit [Methylococcales bacterium]
MRPRPLSPHLQVYRLPITGIISISHRLTGLALTVLFAALSLALFWLPDMFESVQEWLNWLPIRGLLWLFSAFFSLHLVHGIRHLFWDTGKSFAKADLTRLATLELIVSLALTLFLILIVL